MITLIVCWHRHDGARAIRHQDKVCHPYWNWLAAQRIIRLDPKRHSLLFKRFEFSLTDASAATVINKVSYCVIPFCHLGCQRVISSNCHKGGAVKRIWPRRKNAKRFTPVHQLKVDLKPLGTANPIALHGLNRIRPTDQAIEFVQQLISVSGNANEPLRNFPLFDHRT